MSLVRLVHPLAGLLSLLAVARLLPHDMGLLAYACCTASAFLHRVPTRPAARRVRIWAGLRNAVSLRVLCGIVLCAVRAQRACVLGALLVVSAVSCRDRWWLAWDGLLVLRVLQGSTPSVVVRAHTEALLLVPVWCVLAKHGLVRGACVGIAVPLTVWLCWR